VTMVDVASCWPSVVFSIKGDASNRNRLLCGQIKETCVKEKRL
jgi:hypothetical protein